MLSSSFSPFAINPQIGAPGLKVCGLDIRTRLSISLILAVSVVRNILAGIVRHKCGSDKANHREDGDVDRDCVA